MTLPGSWPERVLGRRHHHIRGSGVASTKGGWKAPPADRSVCQKQQQACARQGEGAGLTEAESLAWIGGFRRAHSRDVQKAGTELEPWVWISGLVSPSSGHPPKHRLNVHLLFHPPGREDPDCQPLAHSPSLFSPTPPLPCPRMTVPAELGPAVYTLPLLGLLLPLTHIIKTSRLTEKMASGERCNWIGKACTEGLWVGPGSSGVTGEGENWP